MSGYLCLSVGLGRFQGHPESSKHPMPQELQAFDTYTGESASPQASPASRDLPDHLWKGEGESLCGDSCGCSFKSLFSLVSKPMSRQEPLRPAQNSRPPVISSTGPRNHHATPGASPDQSTPLPPQPPREQRACRTVTLPSGYVWKTHPQREGGGGEKSNKILP